MCAWQEAYLFPLQFIQSLLMKAQQQEICSPFRNDKDCLSRIYPCFPEVRVPTTKLFQVNALVQAEI